MYVGFPLGKFIPSFDIHIGNYSFSNTLFAKKAGPIRAKVGEVRIVDIQPTVLTPDSYVKAQVRDVEVKQTISQFLFDAHPKLTLKKGEFISVDTLIGYDVASQKQTFYSIIRGANKLAATLVINPDAIMAIQPRVVPFANQHKTSCDDDRWNRAVLDSGSCNDLEAGLLDASVAAFQVGCLKKAWPVIKKQIVLAELYRNKLMLKHMRQLYPDPAITWKSVKLKVIFRPNRPALTRLPAGWYWADKHDKVWKKGAGDIFLVKKVRNGKSSETFKVDLNHLKCTAQSQLTKRVRKNLFAAARAMPATNVN